MTAFVAIRCFRSSDQLWRLLDVSPKPDRSEQRSDVGEYELSDRQLGCVVAAVATVVCVVRWAEATRKCLSRVSQLRLLGVIVGEIG